MCLEMFLCEGGDYGDMDVVHGLRFPSCVWFGCMFDND